MATAEYKLCVVYWLYDDDCVCLWRHGYIGITKGWKGRLKNHRRKFRNRAFKFKILFEGSVAECRMFEYALRPIRNIGWNTGVGGGKSRFGVKASESSRQKMREAQLRRPSTSAETREKLRIASTGRTNCGRIGQKKSPEERAKISVSHMGKKQSAEHNAKMGATKIGNKYRLGKDHSEETRLKIARSKRGVAVHSEEHKRKLAERWQGNALTKGKPWSSARRLAHLQRRAINANILFTDQVGLFAE